VVVLGGASGCGSSSNGEELTASAQARLLARIDHARDAARRSDRRRAQQALGALSREVRRLAVDGAIDESRTRRLQAQISRAQRLAAAELEQRRERPTRTSPEVRNPTGGEGQEEEGD
jgi:hypothetical protein